MWGPKNDGCHTTIVNGADREYFYPAGNTMMLKPKAKIRCITTGYFRNLDQLEPIIKACDLLKEQMLMELTVLGPVDNPVLKDYLKREYIVHKTTSNIRILANALRSSHIFIYSHLNPPCPNSVIEAVSCGLPIVSFDSGSMRELLPFGIDLLASVSNDLFQRYEDFKYEKLAEKIVFAVDNYGMVKERAMAQSHSYPFDECGRKYVEVFTNILRIRDASYETTMQGNKGICCRDEQEVTV